MSHPLGITATDLARIVSQLPPDAVIDELVSLPAGTSDDDRHEHELTVSARLASEPAPEPGTLITPGARSLELPVRQLAALLRELDPSTIINAISGSESEGGWKFSGHTSRGGAKALADKQLPGLTVHQRPRPAADAPSTSSVFMAPAGAPLPTSVPPGDGWVQLGSIADEVSIVTDEDPDERTASGGDVPPFSFGPVSMSMTMETPNALSDLLDQILDDQIDQTISAADRAVDEVDLEQLAAELRLMLPEFDDIRHDIKPPRDLGPVDYGTDYEQGKPDGYSAEAIVAWFREQVAAARRRAYRTGYTIGRHAGEHQEPTA